MSSELSDAERALVLHLLSVDFPGVEALRTQVASLSVSERDPHVLVFDLVGSVPRANVIRNIPVEGTTALPMSNDELAKGHVLLFVEEGRLASLEYYADDQSLLPGLPLASEVELVLY